MADPLLLRSDPDDAFSLLRAELAKRSQILHSPAGRLSLGTSSEVEWSVSPAKRPPTSVP